MLSIDKFLQLNLVWRGQKKKKKSKKNSSDGCLTMCKLCCSCLSLKNSQRGRLGGKVTYEMCVASLWSCPFRVTAVQCWCVYMSPCSVYNNRKCQIKSAWFKCVHRNLSMKKLHLPVKKNQSKNPSVLFHVPMRVWILILKKINK